MRIYLSLSSDQSDPTPIDFEAVGFDHAKQVGLDPHSIIEIEPGVSLMVFDTETSAPTRVQDTDLENSLKKVGIKFERYRKDYLGLGPQAAYYKMSVN